MKVVSVHCGAYHSFIQNAKGELYGFGLNLKGQLGLGSTEDRRKPVLVHSLLPGGNKNPKASFFADTLSECRRKRRSKEELPELANITNISSLYSPLASKNEEE
jgi:alpha-tubulin suppressor-like RCC1 family protein